MPRRPLHTIVRGLARPFHSSLAGAPSLSRSVRQGRDFDFPVSEQNPKKESSHHCRGASAITMRRCPGGLKRYQEARCLHFVRFSCYERAPRLNTPRARDIFEKTLEDTRKWYGFYVAGYVVMPEHVHLLLTEPKRTKLSVALQMLKQNVARQLREPQRGPLWQPRYYAFNVWSYAKQTEKLRYIHRNPVRRGLVRSPEEWVWSSFRHYLSGIEGVVEIESQWSARKREQMGKGLR